MLNTVIEIANPGNVATHQAPKIMYSRPSASMPPQDGVGGCVPRPKKLNPDSKMMS
jgi:hypothetical protein